jgi:hypothetical protein
MIAQQFYAPDWRARAFFEGYSAVFAKLEVGCGSPRPAGDNGRWAT